MIDYLVNQQESTDRGDHIKARFVICANGTLSKPKLSRIRGMESFAGHSFHTSRWDYAYTGTELEHLGDKVVGIIGTGSSAIQAIPILAEQAGELFVFQRTPNFSMPARNKPMDPDYQSSVRKNYDSFRWAFLSGSFGLDFRPSDRLASETPHDERLIEYEKRWEDGGLSFIGAFADTMVSEQANDAAAEFIRAKIRHIVEDPEVADLLCPDTPLSCKRPCSDTSYYETFNRSNVKLVDISNAPIEEISENGVRTGGRDYDLDALVFATGFDAMTGALLRIDIRGRNGVTLRERWAEGPRTYLGLCVQGFPNLFTITGPGSPSVLANMIPGIEQHVDWIADCILHLQDRGFRHIETTRESERAWGEIVNDIANRTLFTNCNSWYVGANIPGKPRGFMVYIGFPSYVERCKEVVRKGYEGFELSH